MGRHKAWDSFRGWYERRRSISREHHQVSIILDLILAMLVMLVMLVMSDQTRG